MALPKPKGIPKRGKPVPPLPFGSKQSGGPRGMQMKPKPPSPPRGKPVTDPIGRPPIRKVEQAAGRMASAYRFGLGKQRPVQPSPTGGGAFGRKTK